MTSLVGTGDGANRPGALARSARGPSGWVLVATCIGYGMVILDTTVVNIALPAISRDLGASTSALEWVVDGYSVVFAVCLLSAGALGDRRGAKQVFLCGLALFSASSLACGLAPSTLVLIVARLVQGLGAAIAVPSSLALLQVAYPHQAERARAVGMWGAMAGVAAAAGPALGGIAVDALGWRSVFFINVPLGVVGIVLGRRHLPLTKRHTHGLDLVGQVTVGVSAAALAIGLIDAGATGWSSTTVLACLATFLAGTALFVVVERRARRPMLPLALFSSSTFSAATVVGFLCNLGFFGELFVMSLYLQQERGLSALAAGFVLAPQMAATMLGSVLSGRVMAHRGPRRPMLVGLGVGSAGLLSLALAGLRTPYWLLLPSVTLAGFGIAFTMMPATAAVIETAGEGRGGVASGSLNAARQLGGMVGVALLGSFVAGRTPFIGGFRIDMILAAGAFAIALGVSGAFVDRIDGRTRGQMVARPVGRP